MENLTQWAQTVNDKQAALALRKVGEGVYGRLRSASLNSAGLVIKAGGSALAKIGASDWYGFAKGALVKKAAATDMPALSGTVTNAKFNVFVFTVDSAGTVSSAMGTEGATLATVKFPPLTPDNCVIGFVIINPTGTGNFVGGTTALDDVTVAPNAVYISTIGVLDPTATF